MKIENMFIPYNRAKKLKALKFKEECFGSYADVEVSTPILVKRIISDDQGGYFTLAPLFCQVFDWFREKHDLNSFVSFDTIDDSETAYIWNIVKYIPEGKNRKKDTWDFYERYDSFSQMTWYSNFEEAQLACLDKLIEICEKSVS